MISTGPLISKGRYYLCGTRNLQASFERTSIRFIRLPPVESRAKKAGNCWLHHIAIIDLFDGEIVNAGPYSLLSFKIGSNS